MQTANSVEPADLESQRRRLEIDVFNIAVAIEEYFTVGEICAIYLDQRGEYLVDEVRHAGYKSVEELLLKSGRFVCLLIKAKKMFKAEPNAGSEISCYSRGRRKTRRKRPKMTTENREYFMRHELRGTGFASPRGDRPLLGAFGQPNQNFNFVRSGVYYGDPQPPTHGPPKNFFLPQYSKSSGNGRVVTPNEAKSIGFGRSSPTLWGDKANKGPTVKEGVNLFVETLRTCGGIATPDQLREAYKRLIGVEWGPAECLKYFGECTTRDAIVNYMADLSATVHLLIMLWRKLNNYMSHKMDFLVEVEIVTVGDRRIYRLLNKPSLSPHECVVNAVLERYPDTVHMDDLPQILEKHSVRVPMDQPLTQQVPRSFIAYLEVNMDGRITLDLKGLGVNARDLRSQSGAPSDESDSDESFYTVDSCVWSSVKEPVDDTQ